MLDGDIGEWATGPWASIELLRPDAIVMTVRGLATGVLGPIREVLSGGPIAGPPSSDAFTGMVKPSVVDLW